MTISATVIAHSQSSVSPRHKLLSTALVYPAIIHGELMTHRVFSRSASSSRAIPVGRMIEDIIRDTAMPVHWGKHQSGMQAREEHAALITVDDGRMLTKMSPTAAWFAARDRAIDMAMSFHAAGYHKQVINRLLMPFMHMRTLVTSTEWDNFYELRCHEDADPTMRALAEAMREAHQNSTPTILEPGEWHTPFVDTIVPANPYLRVKMSVARSARVSYKTFDNKESSAAADWALHDRLVGSTPIHASPAEHQATPDEWMSNRGNFKKAGWANPGLHGNFTGFCQYRKYIEHGVPVV